MKKITYVLLLTTLFISCVSPDKGVYNDTRVDKELPVIIEYFPTRTKLEMSKEDLAQLLVKLEIGATYERWYDIGNLSDPVYLSEFPTEADLEIKTLFVEILAYKALAHKNRVMWDVWSFKYTYKFLEEIALEFDYAKQYVELFKPYYIGLVPPEDPWLLSHSKDNLAGNAFKIETLSDGTGFVTVGQGKVIKIWNNDFTLRKQIPLLSNQGNQGIMFALAVHPYKPIVACGGFSGYDWEGANNIYYINYETSELLHVASVAGNTLKELSFSPNGKFLVQGNGVQGYFSVYDTETWKVTGSHEVGIDIVEDAAIESISTMDDSFILLYSTGLLRRYDYNLNLISERSFSRPGAFYEMDINPDKNMISLVISNDNVKILNSLDFTDISVLQDSKGMDVVKWDSKGGLLASGEYYRKTSQKYLLHYWESYLDEEPLDYEVGFSAVNLFTQLSNGDFAYIDEDKEQGLICNGEVKVVRRYNRVIFDRSKGDQFLYAAPIGTNLAFFDKRGMLLKFDLKERTLSSGDGYRGFQPTKEDSGNRITIGSDPKINDVSIHLKNGYHFSYARSGSLLFKKNNVVWTNGHWLFLTDLDGKRIWQKDNLSSTCLAVYGTYDWRYVIAAFSDGSLRWYDQQTGKELLNLIIDPLNYKWIIYTPEGYYDSSDKEGAALVAFHYNNGADKTPTRAELDQFSSVYYRPDIIDEILDMEVGDDISEYQRISFRPPSITDFYINNLLVEPGYFDYPMKSDVKELLASFVIESNTPEIRGVEIFNNGKSVSFKHLKEEGKADITLIGDNKYRVDLKLPITFTENNYRVFFKDERGVTSPERLIHAYYSDQKSAPKFVVESQKQSFERRENLHVLLIGVSDYVNPEIGDLMYPDEDVKALGKLFEKQKDFYKDIKIHSLYEEVLGGPVTKKHIEDTLSKIKSAIKSNDSLIVYLSGHGTMVEGSYYFLTADADTKSKETLDKTTITFTEFGNTLKSMGDIADVTVMLDSCYSGNLSARELGYLMEDTGLTLIMSSRGDQLSIESPRFNHGLFTYSLLEAFGEIEGEGSSDLNGDKLLNIGELMIYMSDRMNSITGGLQVPWLPDYSANMENRVIGYIP